MTDQTCTATKADGTPCQSTLLYQGGPYCIAHAPGGSERMAERGRKGAAATAKKLQGDGLHPDTLGELQTPADAQRWLREIALAIGRRAITHSEGRSMAGAVRTWLDAHGERLKAEEFTRLREQVRELKRAGLKAS